VKRTLKLDVTLEPSPEAAELLDAALDLLADALARCFIAHARAEVLAERGVTADRMGDLTRIDPLDLEEL